MSKDESCQKTATCHRQRNSLGLKGTDEDTDQCGKRKREIPELIDVNKAVSIIAACPGLCNNNLLALFLHISMQNLRKTPRRSGTR